jgi:hypothetical protein
MRCFCNSSGFSLNLKAQKVFMKKSTKLSFAVSLLVASQASFALVPWTDKTPDIVVYTSGGAAQDKAYGQVVTTTLAQSGTVDVFADVDPDTGSVGSRWTAYYFTGNANLGVGLAGKKILLEKRIYGAAGYGVVPLVANIPLEQLNLIGSTATKWQTGPTVSGAAGSWKATITSANASQYLANKISDAGFLGVDPSILLKPGTQNYPKPVNTLLTGSPEANWPLTITKIPTTGTSGFTIVPTGGLVYGVAVTADLYKVLQAAQKRAGALPSSVTIGSYNEDSLPSLNRNVVASLLAGKIGAWNQIKIVDKTDSNIVKTLLDTDILTDASVSAPYKESTTGNNLTPVAVGKRNAGAAVGAVAYAKFLNYPVTPNSAAPASTVADNAVAEDASLPIVKAPAGAADTGNLLKDWQNGTNATGFNNVVSGTGFAKRWGIAINSADRNNAVTTAGTGGDPWRYIKIDGYAPTLENVAAGVYPIWAEGAVLYHTTKADTKWALKTKLLKALADDLGSPTVANVVNTTQPWGKTGIFATTADPRGFKASIPFSNSNPVVPFSHRGDIDSIIHTEIVPTADATANGGLAIQLK